MARARAKKPKGRTLLDVQFPNPRDRRDCIHQFMEYHATYGDDPNLVNETHAEARRRVFAQHDGGEWLLVPESSRAQLRYYDTLDLYGGRVTEARQGVALSEPEIAVTVNGKPI